VLQEKQWMHIGIVKSNKKETYINKTTTVFIKVLFIRPTCFFPFLWVH